MMQFHEYRTMRNQFIREAELTGGMDDDVARVRQVSSAELREKWIEAHDQDKLHTVEDLDAALVASGEGMWVNDERPYYNVWPIALELAKSVKLNLKLKSVIAPFPAMLLRFAKGYEPFDVNVALVTWPTDVTWNDKNMINLATYRGSKWSRLGLRYPYDSERDVEDFLNAALVGDDPSRGEIISLLMRLCVFISLLSNNEDLITPIVLAKDRDKYKSTDDAALKTWIENRAARRVGRGFDVGKALQDKKDRSPHWRNPHLCLFWTGPERKRPIIQLRSGSVIQRVSMAEVPTGYLGPESELDDQIPEMKTPRMSISKSVRFEVFKRDNYQCQLCGRRREDGVVLHIDHKKPLARGGSNLTENLWTLCDDCNLGKSDELL